MISENRRRLTAASTFCREWFRKRGVHAFNTVAYVSRLSLQEMKCWIFFSGHFMLVDFRKHLNITTFTQEKELWQRLLDAGVYTVCCYVVISSSYLFDLTFVFFRRPAGVTTGNIPDSCESLSVSIRTRWRLGIYLPPRWKIANLLTNLLAFSLAWRE